MSVPVRIDDDFTYGSPEIVIATPYSGLSPARALYDIFPDGQRFLVVKESGASATELIVVLNWFEELKRLVPTGN